MPLGCPRTWGPRSPHPDRSEFTVGRDLGDDQGGEEVTSMTTPGVAPAKPNLEIPTADELFGPRDPAPTVPLPPAWENDSIAREMADQECARLLVNILFDPPITEEEI